MNALGKCPDCGEFRGGPPHVCQPADPFHSVRIELEKAQAKFPRFNSGHEGWAVIAEELDELWREVRSNQATPDRNNRMRKEAIQVAAMAIRFLADMPYFKN